MKQTMAWEVHGDDLLVVVHGPENPREDEWSSFIEVSSRVRATLAVTAGGGPNSVQRGALTDMLAKENVEGAAAVVTASRLVRGIVTAINWFNKGTRAFAPEDMERAMKYLEVPPEEYVAVRAKVEALAREVGVFDLRLAG